MSTSAQQHPRELIRNALAARPQQPENPLSGGHACFIMLSFVVAICVLIYEVEYVIKQDTNKTSDKWMNSKQNSSVRYSNDINDIRGSNHYDYIIIGAGIAGSVLATKLATDVTYPRVLVIESKSMSALMQDKQNKVTAFKYMDAADQLPVHSNNHNDFWIRSSAKMHHNNIWSIGTPADYDTLWNVSNWKWKDIKPYFRRSERVIIDEIVNELGTYVHHKSKPKRSSTMTTRAQSMIEKTLSRLPIGPARDTFADRQFDYGNRDITNSRGTDGMVLIKQARKYSIVNAFIVNALNANYTYNIDHNTAFNYNDWIENALVNTVSYQQYSKYGIFESYIQKLKASQFAKKRERLVLDVLFETQVTKILFDDIKKSHGKHVGIGVEVINNATKHRIFLRDVDDYERSNEIIVSAGTIDSPKLLMLSGFGDTDYLKACCDIDVIEHNIDIGQNLEDQIKFSLYFRHNPVYKVLTKHEITQWKYTLFSGTMVNASGYDANVFYNPDGSDIPLLQFVLYNGIKPIGVNNADNVTCCNTDALEGVTIDVILLHPKSRGFVQLQSDGVSINPQYLSDEGNQDLELLLKGYKEIENIFFKKEPFDGVVTFGHFWPCDGVMDNDDETIKRYIMNNIQTHHNHIGTNKMGVVVDHNFVLNNTLNVRVVDASTIPSSISGSIQAPIVMMAERASDIMLKKRPNQQQTAREVTDNADEEDVPKHSEL